MILIVARIKTHGKFPGFQMLFYPLKQFQFLPESLVHSCAFGCLCDPPFQNLQIGKDQFQIDRLNIP